MGIIVKNIKDMEYKRLDLRNAFGYEGELKEEYTRDMHRLSSPAIGNQLYVTIYSLPPKNSSYPYHYHAACEEVYYVISGEGELETPSGIKRIGQGDVIVCPAGEAGAHKLKNTSETEPLLYIDVDNCYPSETTFHPHTNKVVITTKGFQEAFPIDSKINYLENE